MKDSKRLLILSCSARKTNEEVAPALLRYQSPVYFLVRRWLRLNPDNNLVIWILSAKYGLIGKMKKTINYNLALTPERAEILKDKIQRQFVELCKTDFAENSPESVFCHLSENYRNALSEQIALVRTLSSVTIATGRPGEKSKMLKEWLEK